MQILYAPLFFDGGCAVALGTFDGVHIGHSKVIKSAKEFNLPTVVVTTLSSPHNSKRILSRTLCQNEFKSLGVESVLYLNFGDIKNLSPTEYLDFLRDKLNAICFCCGYNFKFGKNASGDKNTVIEYADKNGLKCCVTDNVKSASSTNIRDLLARGEISKANEMLGHNYCFDFKVVSGDKRGRTWNFPTINQPFDNDFCIPRFGVYVSKTYIEGKEYKSVTNIGIRPTFELENAMSETYIIGYSGNLYDKNIKVELLHFIRDEIKFNSEEQVKAQIKKDTEFAINYKE
ncbi:MAG: riboflavin biosynthesis protein RibF [Acutalibacteraceae bacterium]|nr:riboflavin biosynthesis protein RibF [Acutalibacteraceae bacterium]